MSNSNNLTAADLAARWRGIVSQHTLANWRSHGKGPRYVKVGRKVLYPLDAVEQFERENLKGSA